jgi:prepilin-type N-terminal cleavage/methylation domain-containing protein
VPVDTTPGCAATAVCAGFGRADAQRDRRCLQKKYDEKGRLVMKNSGFTLIELMIVIAILGIMSTFTIVKFLHWLPRYRLSSAVSSMHCTLQLARVAAVNKNSTVSVLFSPGTNTCSAFLDNGDGGGTPDDGLQNGSEKIVRRIYLPAGVDLKDPTFGSMLQFNNRGMPNAAGDVVVENKSYSKTVRLFLSGKSNIL